MRRLTVLVSIVLALLGSQFAMAREATPGPSPSAGCATTTEAENEAIAHRWSDIWQTQDLDALDALISPDYVHHWGAGADVKGTAAFKKSLSDFFTAFPDTKTTVEETIVDGGEVVLRYTNTGTQTGPLGALAPTGNVATYEGISIVHISCGQIDEVWTEIDGLGRLQQLTGAAGAFAASTPVPSRVKNAAASPAACAATSEGEAADLVRSWFDVWNTRDLASLDALGAADYVHHWGGQVPDTTDLNSYKQRIDGFLHAFPDLHATVDDVIVDGDLVVLRWTETGTQQGRFGNIEPTGKNVTWTGINIFRVECGQLVESWNATDGIGLQQQLGVDLPGTPAAATPATLHDVQQARSHGTDSGRIYGVASRWQ